jgi:capsular exopolysaccharide synthesis family protein
MVVGFLGYAAVPPTYQSTAQLQVIKRDPARVELRTGYIDDYVANQLELLRSQLIHEAAAKSQKMQEASPEFLRKLNEDDLAAHKVMKQGLTVNRSRETGAGVMGNSIVNLAFVADDPRDSQIVLDALIDTYQKELASVSGKSMSDRIVSLEKGLEELRQGTEVLKGKRDQVTTERLKLTPLEPQVLTQRYARDSDERAKLESDLADIMPMLEAIDKVKDANRSERVKLLALLTGNKQGVDPTTNQLEQQLLLLQLRKKQYAENLGEDHPNMKEVTGQISLVQEDLRRINPDDSGKLDGLEMLRFQLSQKEKGLRERLKYTMNRLDGDKSLLDALRPLIVDMGRLEDELRNREKRESDREMELADARATQRATQSEVYEARVNNKPRPGLKVGPVLLLWLAPGLFVGGLVGAGLAMLVELRDKSFRTPAEIRARLGVPVLGHLPNIRLDLPREGDVSPEYDPSLVAAVRPKSVESEAYRGVRAQVLTAAEKFGHAVVQVTSPTPGDGKSTLAANLAISLAQSGKRVVLLDCDFRKPRVHKLFNLPKPEVGLASVTSGSTELTDAIRQSDVDRLDLLPCGPRPNNPAELLSGPRFQTVLNELKSRYDFVIVDTPPLLAVSDPRVVAQRVDGVVLVFRITNKVRPLAERAREYLSDMGANLLGVVVNGGGGGKGDEYGYGYGYSYSYAYDYDYEYAETYSNEDKSRF